MATAEQESTKRPISEEPHSSDLKGDESASKRQKLESSNPPPTAGDQMQPDSTEAREDPGSSDESVDLEGESDGDSDDLEPGKEKGNGEEFDESHSGDLLDVDDDDSDLDGDGSGDSEEELPIIEGLEVELVKGAAGQPADGANNVDAGSYLLRGKQGRVLKLAISETAISEIHNECLSLFDSGRLPHIKASDLEIISDTDAELTVHASTVGVSTSYLARQYSDSEKADLASSDTLGSHILAEEREWCVIEVEGFPALFGSKDLMSED